MSQKQLKLEKVRRQGLSDYYFFCKHILGYSEMELQPHEELCDFITKSKKNKKMINLPRGAFKSSVVTIGYSLWLLINNSNLRILITSETLSQSKVFLQGVKNHIEQNHLFQALYGDLRPASIDVSWRSDEITIGTRTKAGVREASVTASGVGVTKVGMHYDIIIIDDVVSSKNVNTPEQLNKTLEHYRLLLSILDPGGKLIIIGTRYSYSDLYGHIKESESKGYDFLIRSAIDKDTNELYFPARLTREFLGEQKSTQGSYIFSCQYLNSPVDEDNALFKEKWLQFYDNPPRALRHYILVDPAASLENDADFTGIVVCGIDPHNNIVVIEAMQVKVTIYDLITIIFDKVVEYNIADEGCLGLETVAFQKTLKYILIQEMDKRNFFFAISELKRNTSVSKKMRIRALQPYFENGKVFLKKTQYDLIDQILRYPRIKKDDIIDALAGILEVMCPADEIKDDKWLNSNLTQNEIGVWKGLEKITSRKVRRTRKRI